MTTYMVTRHGSNAANQSMIDRMILGLYEATSKDKVCTAASKEHTVYSNQFLRATPKSRISQQDWEEAQEIDARDNQLVSGVCQLCGKSLGKIRQIETLSAICDTCGG